MKSVNKKNEPVKTIMQYQRRKGINSLEVKGATELVDLSIDNYGHVVMQINRDSTKENLLDTETPTFIEINRKENKTFINVKGIDGKTFDVESLNDNLLMVDENEGTFYLIPKSDDTKENLIIAGNEIIEIERIPEKIDETGAIKQNAETKISVVETEITTNSEALEIKKDTPNKFEIVYLGDSTKEYLLRNLTPERLRIDRTDEGTFLTILSDKNKENTLINGNEKLLEIDKQEPNETKLTVLPDETKENILSTDTPDTVKIIREENSTKINIESSGKLREWDYYCVGDKTDKDNIGKILTQYETEFANSGMWCKINIIGKMGFNYNSSGNIRVYQKNVILNFADCDLSNTEYLPLFLVQAYAGSENLIIENLSFDYSHFAGEGSTAITSGSRNLIVRNCNLSNCRFNITRSATADTFQKFTIIDSNCRIFSPDENYKNYMFLSQIANNRIYTNVEINFINCTFEGHNVNFFEFYTALGTASINVDKCLFINSQYQPAGTFSIFETTSDYNMLFCNINIKNSMIKKCGFLTNFSADSSILNIQNNYLEILKCSPKTTGNYKLIFVGNFILPGSEYTGLENSVTNKYYIPPYANYYL